VIHRRLDLLIHRLLHLSLGMSAVAVKHHDQDQNSDDTNDEYLTKAVAVITDIEHASFVVILQVWVLEDWLADVRCVTETSTNGIHDGLCFHLSTISTVIDHD
jgi:hypothetical protein